MAISRSYSEIGKAATADFAERLSSSIMKPRPLLSRETMDTLLAAGLIQSAPVWPMPGHRTMAEVQRARGRRL